MSPLLIAIVVLGILFVALLLLRRFRYAAAIASIMAIIFALGVEQPMGEF